MLKFNNKKMANISAFVFLAAVLAFPSGYSYGSLLFLLTAIFGFNVWRHGNFDKPTIILCLLLIAAGIFWSHSFENIFEMTKSDYWVKYGIAAVCVLAVAKIGIDFSWVAYGIAAGGLGSLGIAAYQYLVLGMNKASGHTNAIQYGDISMYLGVAAWSVALLSKQKWPARLAFAVGGGCAVLGSLLSETRGAWVVAPVLVLCLLVWMFQYGQAKLAGIAVVAMVLAVAVMVIPYGEKFTSRANTAVVELQAYAANPVQAAETSIGQRLEQWRLAWALWEQKPLLGWGTQGFTQGKQLRVDQGLAHPSVMDYGHAHNEILDMLAKRGVLGLVMLLLLYGVPLAVFWPTRKRMAQVPLIVRDRLLSLRVAATLLPIAYFGFGWTQVFFAHNSGNMFYLFALVAFWGGVCQLEGKTVLASSSRAV